MDKKQWKKEKQAVKPSKTIIASERVRLNEIKINKNIFYSTPRPEKYNKKFNYYLNNGILQKTIEIDENRNLVDGYISYLIMKREGIEECEVNIAAKK